MSLEAWGDDGDADRPYTEERVDELIAEATAELRTALASMTLEHANALGMAAAEAAARKRNLARAQELERQLAQSDVLYAQVLLSQRNLKHALLAAVDVIRTWHNMPVPGSPVRFGDKQTEQIWRIYYENAPEMKTIREALK